MQSSPTLSLDQKHSVLTDDIKDAQALCQNHKIKSAFKVLQAQPDQNKKNPLYWSTYGYCYLIDNNLEQAYFNFKRSLSLDDKNINALHGLGKLYLIREQYLDAYEYFGRVLRIDANHFESLYYSALINHYYSNFPLSIQYLDRIKPALISFKNEYNFLFAVNLLYIERYQESLSHFNQVDSQFLHKSQHVNYYAYNLIELGQLEKAHQVLKSQRRPANIKTLSSHRDLDMSFTKELIHLITTQTNSGEET